MMSKKSSALFCALYAFLVIVTASLLFLLPRKDFSPEENRMLSEPPKLDAESLLDGSFTDDFADFCADRFPLRTHLLRLNTEFSLGLGRLESGGVMRGKNGNLIKRLEFADTDALSENTEAISELCRRAEKIEQNAVFFCAPRAVDVLSGFCPLTFDPQTNSLWELIEKADAVTLTELLREKAEAGEYIFYRTDHHWTSLGAYYAYAELGKYLGYEAYPLSDFTQVTVCDDFLGSSYSASLFADVCPDSITALRYDGDGGIKAVDESTGKVSGLYDFSALGTASKYNFFLGGNTAHLKVGDGTKPRLILVKDSFANSLVPLLARHFDIDVIDPRYLRRPLSELIDSLCSDGEPPKLLILFNPETLCGDAGLKKIR